MALRDYWRFNRRLGGIGRLCFFGDKEDIREKWNFYEQTSNFMVYNMGVSYFGNDFVVVIRRMVDTD